jgi:type VI secretion system protein ImpC
MTSGASRVRVEIGADVSSQPPAIERSDGAFRVLILGAFSGGWRAGRQPLGNRTVWRIDRDGIDAAIAGIAPELRLTIDPAAEPNVIAVRSLEDLHPDRLLNHVPMLVRLRELRAKIESQPAGARLRPPPALPKAASTATEPWSGSLLDRILDNEPEADIYRGDELSEFVRRAVRPHVVSEIGAEQRELVAKVDDVLVATLRVLLHHPEFQAFEALWRGVEFFVRRTHAHASVQIGLLDLGKTELAAAVAGGDKATRAVLDSVLSSPAGGSSGSRWSLVIGAYSFGPNDLGMLNDIASLASATGTPWIAAADPRFAGAMTFSGGADVDDWEVSPIPGWDELRQGPNARFLALALPRFLLRLPYGARTDPTETMAFEELPADASAHDAYLWGNPAFLCGLVASEQVEPGAPRPSHGTIGGLPLHISTVDGVSEAKPCAEALVSQRALMHLLDRGLTPLVSERDGDAVRVPRLQSIATPPAPLAVRPIEDR